MDASDQSFGQMNRFPLLFSSDSEAECDDDSLHRNDHAEVQGTQRAAEINPASSPGIVNGNGGAVHARNHGRVARPSPVSIATTPHAAYFVASTSPGHPTASPTSAQTKFSLAPTRKAAPPWIPNGIAQPPPNVRSTLERQTKKFVNDCLERVVDQEIEVHRPCALAASYRALSAPC